MPSKVVGAQHHRPIGSGIAFEEPPRGMFFNDIPQPHELINALRWLHVARTFEGIHGRAADRTVDDLSVIEHCEIDDHPIEVVVPYLAALQSHWISRTAV